MQEATKPTRRKRANAHISEKEEEKTGFIAAITETAKDVFQNPRWQYIAKYLFLKPAIFVTLVVFFTYLIGMFWRGKLLMKVKLICNSFLGYFRFSILWCFFITTTVGSTCKILLKRKIRQTIAEERKIGIEKLEVCVP